MNTFRSYKYINKVIKEVIDPDTARLAKFCLRSTFFSFQGEFYEQTIGVAMGSPLSPIVANLYMEKFEKEALNSYPLKPSLWKRYVDDTNVIWPHGKNELKSFFEHLNNRLADIKFTMELEENGSIPFLDVLITRKEDGTLGHRVFRKKTNTESYLHVDSHRHPSQKIGFINTLAIRASRISDTDHLQEEKDHLKEVFLNIGYEPKAIKKALDKANSGHSYNHATSKDLIDDHNTQTQTCGTRAYLPYIQGVIDKISRILKRSNITTSFKPLETIK